MVPGQCQLSIDVLGDTGGLTGPMGSKVQYLLTFPDLATRNRLKSVVASTFENPNLKSLNPIEKSLLEGSANWLNVMNSVSSLSIFQILNSGRSPDITSPGLYKRAFSVLDSNGKAVCTSNKVQPRRAATLAW